MEGSMAAIFSARITFTSKYPTSCGSQPQYNPTEIRNNCPLKQIYLLELLWLMSIKVWRRFLIFINPFVSRGAVRWRTFFSHFGLLFFCLGQFCGSCFRNITLMKFDLVSSWLHPSLWLLDAILTALSLWLLFFSSFSYFLNIVMSFTNLLLT